MRTFEGLKKRIEGKDIITMGRTWPAFKIALENRKVIFAFDNERVAVGMAAVTRTRYLYALARLAHEVKKPFKDMTREDIAKFFVWLKSNNIGYAALERDRACIKRFFKWHLGRDEEYPDCVKWLKKNGKDMKHEIQPGELLTLEDIRKLIDACDNMRDKAIISILAETGCRRGEIVSCRIKDVQFHDKYATIFFPGAQSGASKTGVAKTGSYGANLIDSEPYVRAWLNQHPNKDNPDSPLFIGYSKRCYGSSLEVDGVYIMLKKIAKRAGLKKRCYTHLFRHSKASTLLLAGYSGTEINLLQGRKKDSKVVNAYLHIDTEAIRKKQLIERGLLQEKKEENPLEPQKCWRCSAMNPADGKFCTQCGAVLQAEARDKIKHTAEQAEIALSQFPAMGEIEKLAILYRKDPESVQKAIDAFKELQNLKK